MDVTLNLSDEQMAAYAEAVRGGLGVCVARCEPHLSGFGRYTDAPSPHLPSPGCPPAQNHSVEREMSGESYKILSRLIRAFSGKKITIPGAFRSVNDHAGLFRWGGGLGLM